jgi:hypothetical protein
MLSALLVSYFVRSKRMKFVEVLRRVVVEVEDDSDEDAILQAAQDAEDEGSSETIINELEDYGTFEMKE